MRLRLMPRSAIVLALTAPVIAACTPEHGDRLDIGAVEADLASPPDLAKNGCLVDADCPRSDAGLPQLCCNRVCIDFTSDIKNCGGCGKVCSAAPNAIAACENSVCKFGGCQPGYADCDKMAANGCEVTTSSDSKNCGACGKACPPVLNGTGACLGGACAVTACNEGYGDCDTQSANGCEVNLNTDSAHCGKCKSACSAPANAGATCAVGACGFTCQAGYADCNNVAGDGCEIDTKSDAKNCGKCGSACLGGGKCVNGTCTYPPCAGFSSGGYCWYEAAAGASCTAACAGHGASCVIAGIQAQRGDSNCTVCRHFHNGAMCWQLDHIATPHWNTDCQGANQCKWASGNTAVDCDTAYSPCSQRQCSCSF